MISVENALALVREHCSALAQEVVPIAEAMARVLAETVFSPNDLPPFDNSAMDGFALRWNAQLGPGTELHISHEQAAGDGVHQQHLGACSIMTGARLPEGLDCVIPVEEITVLERDDSGTPLRIALQNSPRQAQNVRRAGEDIARGQTAVAGGTWLGAEELMLLRGIGCGPLKVRQRPRCALICTGRELVDEAQSELLPGQIYNTNGPFLSSELTAAGAEIVFTKTIADEIDAFLVALQHGIDAGAQVVISTGAVSMGRYDFIPEALRKIGASIHFHKVQMRPGKPLLFARLVSGQLFFGLPGNPVSSAVGARFFVTAALRELLGLAPEQPWHFPLAHDVQKKPEFRLWQKAQLILNASGQVRVKLLSGQESFKTRPLLESKVWAVLPENQGAIAAGSVIAIYPRRHTDSPLFSPDAH